MELIKLELLRSSPLRSNRYWCRYFQKTMLVKNADDQLYRAHGPALISGFTCNLKIEFVL